MIRSALAPCPGHPYGNLCSACTNNSNPGFLKPLYVVIEMYCVKCRTKKIPTNPQRVTMKNGKAAIKANCPDCGTGMYKIGTIPQALPDSPDTEYLEALRNYLAHKK